MVDERTMVKNQPKFESLYLGKTFTIGGGDRKFNERGLLPRALAYIYENILGLVSSNLSTNWAITPFNLNAAKHSICGA